MATAALFIALANTHAKLEVHIVRRLALHHEEHGWCGVRGCAEQLGLVTRLWASAGPSYHDAASRCLQHGPAAPCRGGARALSDEPCVPESAQAIRWPEPSRAAADLGAARRGKPTSAIRWHPVPRCFGGCPCPCCPSPPKSMTVHVAGCPLPRATGAVPEGREAPCRVHMTTLRATFSKKVCCIQQSSTKQQRTYPPLMTTR